MLKLEERQSSIECQAVQDLLKRIRTKLSAMGFTAQEAGLQILGAVRRVFKINSQQPKDAAKLLLSRLRSEKFSRKVTLQLIIELDLFLHSIHDNYDQESEEKNLKIETPLPEKAPFKQRQVEPAKTKTPNNLDSERYRLLDRYLRLPGFLGRQGIYEGQRARRMFQRCGRIKEVKLEYLNGDEQL